MRAKNHAGSLSKNAEYSLPGEEEGRESYAVRRGCVGGDCAGIQIKEHKKKVQLGVSGAGEG